MTDKTTLALRALTAMAKQINKTIKIMQEVEQWSDVRPSIYPEWMQEVMIYGGLIGSGLSLKQAEINGVCFPTQFEIEIEGVKFFEYSKLPMEVEK